MIPRKLFIEVLLDPGNLLHPTIGLHHMEGRFLHLPTLLKIIFPQDHLLNTQKVPHRNRRPLQSSNIIGSEPSLDTKVLCLPQIQARKEANKMFKLNGRLGRLLLNPSPSLLLMIQSLVQHIPKKMIYLF